MGLSSNNLIEIRVITYRRPLMLQRALECLQQQTHQDWRAIVFDDSPYCEGQSVVKGLNDARINYRSNSENLGMVLNTSQAFAPAAYLSDSRYACVLEDDNLFDPGLLEANLRALHASGLPILSRNYRMVDVLQNGSEILTDAQPMRDRWGSEAREISFQERVMEAFYSYTLGNLGYFWSLVEGVDISVSEEKLHGPVSEVSRAVADTRGYWYEPEALSNFSRFVNKRQTPRAESPASTCQRHLAKLNEMAFTQRLMRYWVVDFRRDLSEVIAAAQGRPDGVEGLLRLAEAGYWKALWKLPHLHLRKAALKAMILRKLSPHLPSGRV